MKSYLFFVAALCAGLLASETLFASTAISAFPENDGEMFSNEVSMELDTNDDDVVYEIWEGMPYRDIKKIYDYRWYYEHEPIDKYNPGAAAFCSFLIPGLGQMINGEIGIGFAYMGGWFLSETAMMTGLGFALAFAADEECIDVAATGLLVALVGALSAETIGICSIVGASRMAKRKNLYIRDLNAPSDVAFVPEASFAPTLVAVNNPSGIAFAPGIAFRINF